MAALFYSYSRVFPDRKSPPIPTEGHGRNGWDDAAVDLSQTVGWFTTTYPVQIATTQNDDILKFVQKTKERIRSLPRQGWSYFAFHYLNDNGRETLGSDPMEINFDFLGQFHQLEREDSLLRALPLPEAGGRKGRSPAAHPPHQAPVKTVGLFDVQVIIENGIIEVRERNNARMAHQDRLGRGLGCMRGL